ncbi:Uncharacterized membrane protein [Salmonella enterica subsp. enterica]|uniref:Uncharacterized membrane protein n=1 Tax=Salmonella enterica I TaxID=59201 RepID=A0A3S4INT2_SALET|nr:Uncharacterized membrane protein [Salmonella enterica subsp. enterica]
MLDGDDRVEKPEGICAEAVSPEHPVVNGFSDYPVFLGYNQAVARDDADVVLTINNDPLLVFGEYQQGKTACFMSDCSPHWGTQQFMSWPFLYRPVGQHASIHRQKIKNNGVTKVTPFIKYKD